MSTPQTRYAVNGDVHIAYQVVGDGPFDLVFVPGWVSHLELDWEAGLGPFITRLAGFCRLIRLDKRGTGLSDRVPAAALPTLEERMGDVRAVMDATGSERAALMGVSEGGPMSVLFAATYPERTSALILYGSHAGGALPGEDSFRARVEQDPHALEGVERDWAEGVGFEYFAPSLATNEAARAVWARYARSAASPAAAAAALRMSLDSNVTDVLGAVRVPTLILHRVGDRAVGIEQARLLAERIPASRLVELDGDDHYWHLGDVDAVLAEIQQFLTGVRPDPEPDRVLATVLFTDIVSSTERLVALGDRGWLDLLGQHHALVRAELDRFGGKEIDTAGDGFFATFDGPARAIRCGCAIRDAVRRVGLEVRAGLHTGEVEIRDNDVGGIAVHIGARVGATAQPGEVLVSRTVSDLVAGSGIAFEDRGAHALKGVPGEWQLLAVART